MIATAGAKQGVQLWNAITGGNVASFGDCSSTALLVRFSPSGAFLAAAFEGGVVSVWDPKVGREHLKHEGCHTEPITCIEFSKDSTLLASGSRDRAIQVWSLETTQPLCRLAIHEGPVTSLAFYSDSHRLVSGSEDNLVIIWDILTGKVVRGMMGHRKPVKCVAVSKDGSMVASGSEDKTIKIWDTNSGKCTRTLSKGHHSGIRSIHFFDGDKRLLTTCDDAMISWDVTSRNKPETIWASEQVMKTMLKCVPTWQTKVLGWGTPKSILRYMAHQAYEGTSSERVTVAYASQSPSFVISHIGMVYSGTLPSPLNNPPLRDTGTVTGVSISSDGLWAATADPQGMLEILDLTTKRDSWEEVGTRAKSDLLDNIISIVPSPNGRRFILNATLQWLLIDENYRTVKKIDMGVIGGMRDNARLKFSADGSIFFCLVSNLFNDDKTTVRVFDASTGGQRTQFTGLKMVHSFAASVDGAWIACCHGSDKVEVLGVVGGGRTSMDMPDGDSLVNVLVFSNDARSVIGGFEKGVVRIWDRTSGQCKATLEVSTSKVTALAYAVTPGETRVAIGREDGSLCLWSPSTSASHDVRGAQASAKLVDFVQFSDDRSRLTSRGEDGTVSTWAIPFDADDTAMARCTLCPPSEGADSPSNSDTASPHLLSQFDPEDAVDSLFHTTYRVRKDGWLVDGDRRVVWIPSAIRPHGKNAFYAFANGSVVFLTPSSLWLFLKYVPSRD